MTREWNLKAWLLKNWAAFALASCVLLVIPGPTILTVISYSVAHGNRTNVPLIAAVALGDSTAVALSLAGLGAVLATSAWLFTAVKWVGGLYLIYMGVRLLLAKTAPLTTEETGPAHSKWKLFGNTSWPSGLSALSESLSPNGKPVAMKVARPVWGGGKLKGPTYRH